MFKAVLIDINFESNDDATKKLISKKIVFIISLAKLRYYSVKTFLKQINQ